MKVAYIFLFSLLLITPMTNAMEHSYCSNSEKDFTQFLFFKINRLSSLLPSEEIFGKTYLPYLHYLPAEIFVQNIAPHLMRSKKFWLYTGDKWSDEDDLEGLEEKFDNLYINEKKSPNTVIPIRLPKSLNSNLKQLNKCTVKEKKLIAKNILKFVEYSSKPLASKCNPLIERHLLQATLVHTLDHCNEDFIMLSNKEKQDFLLPQLIEQFKETFGFKSCSKRIEELGNRNFCNTFCPGVFVFFIIVCIVGFMPKVSFEEDPGKAIVQSPVIAILTFITNATPIMIGLTLVSTFFTLYGGWWLYNIHEIYDLDDAL